MEPIVVENDKGRRMMILNGRVARAAKVTFQWGAVTALVGGLGFALVLLNDIRAKAGESAVLKADVKRIDDEQKARQALVKETIPRLEVKTENLERRVSELVESQERLTEKLDQVLTRQLDITQLMLDEQRRHHPHAGDVTR